MTSTPLSLADQKSAERLVSYLKRATDEDLDLIYESLQRAAANLLTGLDWKAMDEFPSSFTALMHFEASVAAEQHHRQDAIRHAEAELSDGHLEPEIWPLLDVGSTP